MKRNKILKKKFGLLIILTGLFILTANTANPEYIEGLNVAEDKDDSLEVASMELLKVYQSLYNDTALMPSSSFRPGHIAEAELRDYLEKTDNGYIVQLPGNTLVPSPVYYKGKIYLSGGFGSKRYYALDAWTGEDLEAWDLDDDGPSSAAVDRDILVFNTESCTIFALDLKTGKQLWSWWLGDPLMCMPTIANGMVFTSYPASGMNSAAQEIQSVNKIEGLSVQASENILLDLSHILVAFDLRTGKVLWQRWINADVMSAPVAHSDDLFVSSFAGTIYKFRQQTGELISVSQVRATSAPVVTKDGIYVSKRADRTGEEASEQLARLSQDISKGSKIYNKKIAVYLDKNVQAGSQLKSQSSEMDAGNGFSDGAPATSGWQKANDMIGQSNVSSLQSFQGSRSLNYNNRNYSTMGNELICMDPETGREEWKLKLGGDMTRAGGFMGTPPLEVGGRIIIATYSGDVIILDPETGETKKKYSTGDEIRYQPIVWDGWIYVTTANSKMHAINTGDKSLTGWPMWGADAARTNASAE